MRWRGSVVAALVASLGALTLLTYLPSSPLAAFAPSRILGLGATSDAADPSADGAAAGGPDHGPDADSPASPTSAMGELGPTPSHTGPLFSPGPVNLTVSGFWSWAYVDFVTGQTTGSATPPTGGTASATPPTGGTASATPPTSDTASMSKVWVAADYLRRASERGQRPSVTTLAQLSTMIRDSDTTHTFEFHVANGNLASIERMAKLCGLTETRGTRNSWSLTQVSARDVARLAKCIGDGRAAGPTWTAWLLNEMRNVRGPGRFGIIEALPPDIAKTTAIKNGWLLRDDQQWHIACLAVGDGWSIGVLARYAGSLGKDYGAKICRDVTRQLLSR